MYWTRAISVGFRLLGAVFFSNRRKPEVVSDKAIGETYGDDFWPLRALFKYAVLRNVKINYTGPRNDFTANVYWRGVIFVTFRRELFLHCNQLLIRKVIENISVSAYFPINWLYYPGIQGYS